MKKNTKKKVEKKIEIDEVIEQIMLNELSKQDEVSWKELQEKYKLTDEYVTTHSCKAQELKRQTTKITRTQSIFRGTDEEWRKIGEYFNWTVLGLYYKFDEPHMRMYLKVIRDVEKRSRNGLLFIGALYHPLEYNEVSKEFVRENAKEFTAHEWACIMCKFFTKDRDQKKLLEYWNEFNKYFEEGQRKVWFERYIKD